MFSGDTGEAIHTNTAIENKVKKLVGGTPKLPRNQITIAVKECSRKIKNNGVLTQKRENFSREH